MMWAPVGKPSLAKENTSTITSSVRANKRRWEWVHFSLPLNADINQKALKRWMTGLIPRGTQEPLCKVRQLGETEYVSVLTLLAAHVFTDGCWHVLPGPIISKSRKVVSTVTKQEVAVHLAKNRTWLEPAKEPQNDPVIRNWSAEDKCNIIGDVKYS